MLQSIVLSHNNRVHSATNKAPNELIFGSKRKLTIDISLAEELLARNEESPESMDEYIKDFNDIIRQCIREAETSQSKYDGKRDSRYEREHKIPEVKFQVGDQVLLHNTESKNGSRAKLTPRWNTGFKVVKIVGPSSYKVEDPNGKPFIVNGRRLQKARSANLSANIS